MDASTIMPRADRSVSAEVENDDLNSHPRNRDSNPLSRKRAAPTFQKHTHPVALKDASAEVTSDAETSVKKASVDIDSKKTEKTDHDNEVLRLNRTDQYWLVLGEQLGALLLRLKNTFFAEQSENKPAWLYTDLSMDVVVREMRQRPGGAKEDSL